MSVRPHVLMTTDAMGGVWTYALDLGRGLTREGVAVSLAVLGLRPDDGQRAQAGTAGLQLIELGGALDWTAASAAEVAVSAHALADLAAQLQPDLIHLNSPALAAFDPLGAPVLAACHSCVATWWAAMKGATPLPPDLAWRAALATGGYAAADALLAPSRAFAQATRAAHGLARTPQVVPNGRTRALPLDAAGLGGDDAAAMGRYAATFSASAGRSQRPPPCPQPSPLKGEKAFEAVITAGRLWDGGKDIDTLDRAAGRLAGVAIAAAGPVTGPNGEAVTLTHVRSLGRLPEAALQMRLSRHPVFVSSSLYEPFGLAVLEAAQAGCPLVLSDIATFRELWEGAAVFFPPGDDAALARLLAALSADPDRRKALGRAARTRAARYSADAMTRATLRIYASLNPAFAAEEAMV